MTDRPTTSSPLTVHVGGTTIRGAVDDSGAFTLQGVPAGDAQVRFLGEDTDAEVRIAEVRQEERIVITVAVNGRTAAVLSVSREGEAEVKLRGAITGIDANARALAVAGRTVRITAATQIREGSQSRAFESLRVDQVVQVEGVAEGDTVVARAVQIEDAPGPAPTPAPLPTPSPAPGPPPSPAPQPAPSPTDVEYVGTLTGMSGSGSALLLTIGGRGVQTTAATVVRRSGNVVGFDALRQGQTIEVKGTAVGSGVINATRLTIEDAALPAPTPTPSPTPTTPPAPAPGIGSEVEFSGVIVTMSGSSPSLTLTVSGRSVRTTSATEVRRKGDTLALSTLRAGLNVQVKGTTEGGGVVLASRITIEN